MGALLRYNRIHVQDHRVTRSPACSASTKQVICMPLPCGVTEVGHMAHFRVSYGRCTMPGSPMGRSEGFSRCWTG